jgi:DNA-binding transcriptional LysR family regulator
VARKLVISRTVVCCSPDYAGRVGLPTSVEEIANYTCIGYANIHSSQIWQFEPEDSGDEIRSLVVRSRIVLNNGEAMRDAAIAGLGLLVLPQFIAAEALASGELIPVLPDVTPVPDVIYAVYPHRRHVPRKIRMVIDHLVAKLNGEPPGEREIESSNPSSEDESAKHHQ